MNKEEMYRAAFEKLNAAFIDIYEILDEREQRAFDFGEVYGTLTTLKEEIEGSEDDDEEADDRA